MSEALVSSPAIENGGEALLHDDPRVHERRWFLLGVLCTSLIMVVMAVSSLNVAAPAIQQGLNASSTELHWIIDAYGIVFAGLLLTAGALGDRYGRKGALLVGLVGFGAGLLIAGVASSAAQVIAGRAVMGVGAAFVMPATLSLITAIFPPEERPRAIAIWAGFAGAGAALGPILSGLMLEKFWWGSSILINLPIVAAVAGVIAFYAPKSRDSHRTPLDPIGAVLSLVGIASALYAIIEGPERGWTDPVVLAGFAAGVLVLAAFVQWERRATHPMLPMDLFRDRRLSSGSVAITLAFFVMFGTFLITTLFMQYALGWSALRTSLALLPFAIVMITVAPRSAGLAERYGAGPVMGVGFLLIGVGFAVQSLASIDAGYPVLLVAIVFQALGISLAMAPATGAIMGSVPLDKAGVGSAINDTTRELGGALGVAVLGSIATSAYRAQGFSARGLNSAQAAEAHESVGGAVHVASQLGPDGQALLTHAQSSFTDAFNQVSRVSLAIALGTALLVWRLYPRRSSEATASTPEIVEPVAGGRPEPELVPVPVPDLQREAEPSPER